MSCHHKSIPRGEKLILPTHAVYVFFYRNEMNLELELLGLLPGEFLVGEVSILSGLVVDGVGEVQLLDDDTGTHVKVLLDDLDQLVRGLVGGTVGLDEQGEGLGNTDGVRELDESTAGQLGGDERLGDPARKVGSRTVDLGVVLTGESTTTVGSPASVGVDNDLTTGQTGITLGSTNDEEARGLDLADVSKRSWPLMKMNLRGTRSSRRGTWRG